MFTIKRNLIIVSAIIVFVYAFLFSLYNSSRHKSKTIYDKNLDIESITIDKVLNKINDYSIYHLDSLEIEFENPSEINEKDLLLMAFYHFASKEKIENHLGIFDIDKYYQNIFGKKISIDYIEKIKVNKRIIASLNTDGDTYYFNDKENIVLPIKSSYEYIVDFDKKDGIYYLIENKFFIDHNCVYPSYQDLISKNNVLFYIDENIEDYNKFIKNYVNLNYDTLKDSLYEYTYEFKKENSNLYLKSYKKKKI